MFGAVSCRFTVVEPVGLEVYTLKQLRLILIAVFMLFQILIIIQQIRLRHNMALLLNQQKKLFRIKMLMQS
jgi:hypothetical protein